MKNAEKLENLIAIIKDTVYLIRNEKIPVNHFKNEKDPEEIKFIWEENKPAIHLQPGIILKGTPEKSERNFICKLCPERISGIRTFIRRGRKPVLVLHYTGEHRKNHKPFSKKNNLQIFRTKEAEDLFGRMIEKSFGFSHLEFFYQEYPGCIFNPDKSEDTDWSRRTENCKSQINETVTPEDIKAIIMLGNSAILTFGIDEAKKMTGKLNYFEINGKQIPMIVLRSPEAVLQLEAKRQKFEKNPDSTEYKTAKSEESELKKTILAELQIFKESIVSIF
ncbi:MAG: hypothetical protein K8R21_09785 [Leptospira sp.]|nr:hypothetical protein [Leptospira sp.]